MMPSMTTGDAGETLSSLFFLNLFYFVLFFVVVYHLPNSASSSSIIEETNRRLRAIESDIKKIKEISHEVASLCEAQESLIDIISENISESSGIFQLFLYFYFILPYIFNSCFQFVII
jgi:hypothetical protein